MSIASPWPRRRAWEKEVRGVATHEEFKSELARVDCDAMSVRPREFEPAVHVRSSDLLGEPHAMKKRVRGRAGGAIDSR